MAEYANWNASSDVFAYRAFANKSVQINGVPVVIDPEVDYFRNRPLNYTVVGESPVKGKVLGHDAANTLRFEASYLRNALNGISRTFHTNGATRDSGDLVMNLPHGEWRFYQPNGQLFSIRNYDAYLWWSIEWSIHLNNPNWNWYQLSEFYFKRPKNFYAHVDGRATFNDRYSPPFSYCVQHGKSVNFHDNGAIADSGYFYKGVKEGLWLSYHENGQLQESGAYKMGKRIGTWKRLYPNGKLQSLRVYKYGDLVEQKSYPENDEVASE